MFKKLVLAVSSVLVMLAASAGSAYAEVDINKASAAELDSLPGIGPASSNAIVEERKKGNFTDWADLESRVKGIGNKSAAKLSQAGLTVDGKPRPNTPAMDKMGKMDKMSKSKSHAEDGKSMKPGMDKTVDR